MSFKNDNLSGNKAIKAGIGYTIGNVLLKGIVFLTLPLFTRLLSPAEYGLYNTYVAYETILTVFSGLCLYGALRTAVRDYHDQYDEFAGIVMFSSTFILIIMLIVGNVFYTCIEPFWEFDRLILNILMLHSYAMFIFQFYNVKLAMKFQYKSYMVLSFMNSFIGTLLSIVLIMFVFTSHGYIGRVVGYASVPIFLSWYIWFKVCKAAPRNKLFDLGIWKYSYILSLPLVIHTFSQQVLSQFGRIIINKEIGSAEAGIYSYVYNVATILQIIVLSLDNAWSAWFYEKMASKCFSNIKDIARKYVYLVNILFIGFISLAPEVLKIMSTPDYWFNIEIIVPMALFIYFIFLYSFPVHVEYFYKKTKFIAIGTMLTSIINVLLTIFLINYASFEIVAWVNAFSYFLLFIFHWIIARKIEQNSLFPTETIIISIIFCCLYSYFVIMNIEQYLVRYIALIIFLSVAIFKMRIEILSLYRSITRKGR